MPCPADLRDAASSPTPAYGMTIDELMSMLAIGDAPEPGPSGTTPTAVAAAAGVAAAAAAVPQGAQSLGFPAEGSASASTSRRSGSTTISRGSRSGLEAAAEGESSPGSGAAASDSSTGDAFKAGQQQHVRLRAMADAAEAASAARLTEEQQRRRSERALVRSPWSHCCLLPPPPSPPPLLLLLMEQMHCCPSPQPVANSAVLCPSNMLLQASMHAAVQLLALLSVPACVCACLPVHLLQSACRLY